MTGPEHYAEAERLVALIRKLPGPDDIDAFETGALIVMGATSLAAQAQVHATLALAAAQAEAHPRSEWREAIA